MLDEQGRIHWWGRLVGPGQYYTEEVSPSGTGFTAIFTSKYAFAALDEEGRIHAWGDKRYGGSATSGSAGDPMAATQTSRRTGAPSGTGFTTIFYRARVRGAR